MTTETSVVVVTDNAVMLTRFRRHRKECPHRLKGRRYTRCRCPVWMDGYVRGSRLLKSLKTTDWQEAGRKIQRLEDPEAVKSKSVDEAAADFLEHCRDLAPSSQRKYANIFARFKEFCCTQNIVWLEHLDVTDFDDYRAVRHIGSLTWSKEIQTLRQFCEFCVRRRWLRRNLAKDAETPKNIKPKEVKPYTKAEVAQIIAACDRFGRHSYERLRARAMVLLMRYTGLRISDVMTLDRDRVRDGMIHLHTVKTAGVVRLPIPVELQQALDELPVPRGATLGCPYYFWNAHTAADVLTRKALRSLRAVFKTSGVRDAHSHRFRHTLATEILAEGGSIQDVADVLGIGAHVATKHYAKWNLAREERIIRLMQAVHGHVYEAPTKQKGSLQLQ